MYPVTQRCADPCHELRDAERFCDEIVCALIQRGYFTRLVVKRRKHDDSRRAGRSEWTDKIGAVSVRQAQVKDGQIKLAGTEFPPCVGDAARLLNVKPFRNERGSQKTPDWRFIIDDERPEAAGLRMIRRH